MDVEKTGYYKLYRCRSLLACDSGGTVYDTSQRFENLDGSSTPEKNAESPSESSLPENIIYIIDKDERVKSSPPSQPTLTDAHYCLEEFNDCKPCSSVNYEHMEDEPPCNSDNCKYYIVQCNDIDSAENSTLDSDTFDNENFEYYCDSMNVSSPVEDINSSSNNTISGNIFIDNQQEFLNLSNISQETEKSLDCLDEAENHSPLCQKIEAIVKHTRKRKLNFTQLVKDVDSSDASLFSGNSKKKATFNNRLQFQKCNPFENLKLSSILKKETANQIQTKKCARESFAPTSDDDDDDDGSSELSSVSYSDQVFSSRSFLIKDHFFVDTCVKLNSDLTNANYLEYVQPREKIVESDMDKLLSPTIEVDFSTVMQHCQVNQCVQEAQRQIEVDCNGNDVNLRENLNHSFSSNTSAKETVEKQLVSKAFYAIKLGYQNIFNTSNECVVEEILYDCSFAYKNIQLEINVAQSSQPGIPLVSNGNQNLEHQLNNPFKNVSCSLKDTLNELKDFGGFGEDNCKDEINETITNHFIQAKPASSSFNSLVEANQVDMNANLDSKKYQVPNTSINEKHSIAPLKMRIKRVGDDNQYVIDDSRINHGPIDDKMKFQRNSDSKYECSSCLEKFRTKKLLKSHISENHKGPYDMECEICHMRSRKNSAYKKHEPWCEKSTALKCEICHKVYCYKAVLLRHLNTHKDGF